VSRLRGVALGLVGCLALLGCSGTTATPQIIYVTPAPTPTPVVLQPTASPSPAPTRTPVVFQPTASPSPAPASFAEACSGTEANRAAFADAASKVTFTVYCAVLPSDWQISSLRYLTGARGWVTVKYGTASGSSIQLSEGAWCTTSSTACLGPVTCSGTAYFADLPGISCVAKVDPSEYYVFVDTGTSRAYRMDGVGMSKDQFQAWASALAKVRKS
jgi:hypothetical protein